MYGRRKIAVVIPAYNEELLIQRTLRGIPTYVDSVFLVDDGSTDSTLARALEVSDERTRVLQHAGNRGVGAAIVTGYREALADACDIVVVIGGDAQMDPNEMDRLIEPIVANVADYVKGDRLGHPDVKDRMPAQRLWANTLLTRATRFALGTDRLRDSQCGYTAISATALRALPLTRVWPKYGYPNDILAWLHAYDFRVVDRPVTPIYEDETSHIDPLTIGPTMCFVLARAWWRCSRMRYAISK